jgi:SET domain-containing protein
MIKIFQIDSLRYGLICSHQTIRPIKAGEEIFSDYGYTIAFKLTRTRGIEWYYDEWREFKAKYPDHLKVKQLTKIINKHIII